MPRPAALLALASLLAPAAGCVPTERAPRGLLTRAERSEFRETSSHAEVVALLERAADREPTIRLVTFGYTSEGRPLPLAILSDLDDPTPEAIRASGKTVVYLQGNIHGGEVCGKEALQMLVRDHALGRHDAWLETMVLLVAPIYNADGNERVSLTSRGRQHGPIGGMGVRPNAQGLDLNRDHMKLDAPEARSFARLLTDYGPHVALDLHTTNGTQHAYHLTYSPPLHPDTPETIDRLLRDRFLPRVTGAMRAAYGWETYYYGNAFAPGGGERGWYTFDHRPRFNNNYLGLRNRLGILSEAYAYATFEERVLSTLYFVEEVLDFVAGNGAEVRRIVAEADGRSVVGDSLTLRARFARSAEPVDILMGATTEEPHPLTGQPLLLRRDTQHVEPMHQFGTFEPTLRGRAPAGYLVPPELGDLLVRLRAHGVATEPAPDSAIEVEAFRVDSVTLAERPFQGHTEQTWFGRWEPGRVTPAPGTVWVPVAQPLGRLVFALLEPRADDGFAAWGLVTGEPSGARVGGLYPILRGHGTPPE